MSILLETFERWSEVGATKKDKAAVIVDARVKIRDLHRARNLQEPLPEADSDLEKVIYSLRPQLYLTIYTENWHLVPQQQAQAKACDDCREQARCV